MNISVIGSGKMGKDISILFSQSNHIDEINLISLHTEINKKETEFKNYLNSISSVFEKKLNKKMFEKIKLSNDLEKIKNSKFIIESVIEDNETKIKVIKKANSFVSDNTLFFTNSSSLNLHELQRHFKHKKNFFGMHFFNPVLKTKIIELIYINKSQKKDLLFYQKFFSELKRQSIIIEFFPGYIVNRILLSQINEACDILQNQSLTPKEIDDTFKAATNSFKGPFQVADLIGNDIVLNMLENLYEQTKNEKFKPNKKIKDMVKKNKLGNKTKSGFYQNLSQS
tara:strand:- start:196 stop:1044 length:849 start_codon:yes stop_codon:yes gene_type:complete